MPGVVLTIVQISGKRSLTVWGLFWIAGARLGNSTMLCCLNAKLQACFLIAPNTIDRIEQPWFASERFTSPFIISGQVMRLSPLDVSFHLE